MRGEATDADGSDTRQETRKDDRQYHKVKFLLPQEAISSRSQVRRSTAYDGDGIERPSLTLIFVNL